MKRRTYKELHQYQLGMIDWMLNNEKCALWAGVGLGKTVTALTALDKLLKQKQIHKILVIAPLRVAKFVWPNEPSQWEHLGHIKCTVLHGTRAERERLLESPVPIHVVNNQMVQW